MFWGGGISNSLGLPFHSPFVNVRVGLGKNDYYQLLECLDFYMENTPSEFPHSKHLDLNWAGWEGRIPFPKLWYGDIMLHGFHFLSQQDFLECWEKRRKRYRPEHKLVLKILYDEEDIERFEQLECGWKVGFFYGKTEHKDIVKLYTDELNERYAYQFASYLYDLLRSGELFTKVDLFTLLADGVLKTME